MVETPKWRTRIVEIEVSAADSQLTADIKVVRAVGSMHFPTQPQVDDLPKDVREALIAWLTPAS